MDIQQQYDEAVEAHRKAQIRTFVAQFDQDQANCVVRLLGATKAEQERGNEHDISRRWLRIFVGTYEMLFCHIRYFFQFFEKKDLERTCRKFVDTCEEFEGNSVEDFTMFLKSIEPQFNSIVEEIDKYRS
jgi:hypothetical protein